MTLAAFVVAVGTASALAQNYTFQMRLIPDTDPASPGGPTAALTYTGASRIGFWLQARVSQTSGENWGITRASSPAGNNASFISIADPANATSLGRGAVNTGGTLFGRGLPYRNGGANSGQTGNIAGSTAFPSSSGNENGALDNGGAGFLATRLYGFDSYVGATRADTDFDSDGDVDDNGDGTPENPWGVNGGSHAANVSGTPWPSDGTFAPWANLYRFYVDIGSLANGRVITVNASALLNGAIQAAPTSEGGSTYAMQLSAGQALTTSFTINVPTPGAAAVLGLGGLALGRRRR
jgi:uncharacterized protein (TIGR03382 family)